MIPGMGNPCPMLLVFLLPLLVVWLKDIWWIFVRFFQGWLTNALMQWLTIRINFFGLALYFVGKILLCFGRYGFANALAISVVSQIKDGDNPVSLFVAKTLLGLDSIFHGGESQNFLGNPLTLHIWLMEWLDVITKPTVGTYDPSSPMPQFDVIAIGGSAYPLCRGLWDQIKFS